MSKGYYYTVETGIEPNTKGAKNFDINDWNYVWGDIKDRPPDFDLHLALCILERETLPQTLLEPLKQWVKDNKMLISQRY